MGDALDQLPTRVVRMLDNVVITVDETAADGAPLLGLYHGIALTERTHNYTFAMPDEITLYRQLLMKVSADEDELAHQIVVTLVHELGHHVGIDDDRLHDLGWG